MLRTFKSIVQPLREKFVECLTSISNSLSFCSYFTVGVATLGLSYFIAKNIRFSNKYFTLRKVNFVKRPIVIVNNLEDCIFAVSELRKKCNDVRVLGMDCEWRSDNKLGPHRVALLQLAALDGYCSLFRLSNIGQVPECLAEILSDRSIIKTGVAVSNDASKLFRDYGVRSHGCLDLRYLAKDTGLTALGLGKMSELYLGVKLDKHWTVRCSDWEAAELDNKQILYAAKDALMSAYLFEFFNNRYLGKTYPWWRRIFWTNDELWFKSETYWIEYVDKGFSEKSYSWHQSKRNEASVGMSDSKRSYSSVGPSKPPSNIRPYSTKANTARKSPLYHNIFLQAPDGEVLCTCDMKKANWYLNKNIADVICQDPFTLRLKFEPSGRKGSGEGYYAKVKNNVCAVCGSTKSLRRKNVVPHEYRKYFPVKVKHHSSHDVLLLCDICHCRSQYYDQQLRFLLARECNAPFSSSDENAKVIQLQDKIKVRSAARALLKNADIIPEERQKKLELIIRNHLKEILNDGCSVIDFTSQKCEADKSEDNEESEKVTDDLPIDQVILEELSNIATSVENEHYQPHGLKVVDCYKEQYGSPEDGANTLEKLWRNHFVDYMSPKCLPELWSVDYTHFLPD